MLRAALVGSVLLLPALAAQDAPAPVPVEIQQAPAGPPPGAEPDAEVRRRLASTWEGALLDSTNGQDFAETAGYRRLLTILQAMDPAAVAGRATASLDRAQALAAPDGLRGQYVTLRGLLAGLEAVRLDT